jgi:hypothetical protein
MAKHSLSRRGFIQATGALGAAGLGSCTQGGGRAVPGSGSGGRAISIVYSPADTVAASPAAQWAMRHLVEKLAAGGVPAEVVASLEAPVRGPLAICARGPGDAAMGAEEMALRYERAADGKTPLLIASGGGPLGLVYALTELADRVVHAKDAVAALREVPETHERPANRVRSIMRIFTSDVEDKAWLHDRIFWPRYLAMLATNRFNRFNLSFGLGYDNNRNLRDTYLYFAYPFLLDVPGYKVRATNLSEEERDRNLASLKFISDTAAQRGLHFQLGLWTHAYEAINSPNANHLIEGLTPQTHGPYCRDALHLLLEKCPNIRGVTFRIHGESGVPEGNYDLWKTIFSGTRDVGRPVEIDMHAKGMDQGMIDAALSIGQRVTISPKFWAEHLGLPYHQAAIRELEMPRATNAAGQFSLSSGTRSFLRYGYGDLLTNDRKYGIITRIWPGTHRLLLWADPAYAADYGRAFSFGGEDGFELFDPLSFKGRQGSGVPGHRTAYADETLQPAFDHEKYLLTYRLWGRLTYHPETPKEVWQREYRSEFGEAAAAMEAALAAASRILPLFTTAHLPSGANLTYWPEIYTNLSLVDPSKSGPFTDTPAPRTFVNVSPIDPQMFSAITEHVEGLLAGKPAGKVSPADVAAQLEAWADAAEVALGKAGAHPSPATRRASLDVRILCGMGRFFAHKLRAGLCVVVFAKTGHAAAKDQAVREYRLARDAWASLAALATGHYVANIAFGPTAWLHGSWADRLAAIDADVAALEAYGAPAPGVPSQMKAEDVLAAVVRPAMRATRGIVHEPAKVFRPGESMMLSARAPAAGKLMLHYRHVNQGERWRSMEMTPSGERSSSATHGATIPAEYTNSPFAMQYYFEFRAGDGVPALYPGFAANFRGQPYFVVDRGG